MTSVLAEAVKNTKNVAVKTPNLTTMIKKTLIASAIILSFSSSITFANFSDVKITTEYEQAIQWMNSNGVINGYDDGTFKPDNCVNRVEFLKMLYKTLEINTAESKKELFPDTFENQWYAPYVRTARERKTINGYDDGTFKPEQCVNRVEAIKMAILEFNEGKIPEQTPEFANPYDIAQIKDNPWWMPYYKSAMGGGFLGTKHFKKFNATWEVTENTSASNPTYNYEPAGSMTRKEVAEMLYRMKATKDFALSVYEDFLTPNIIIKKNVEASLKIDQIILDENIDSESNIDLSFDLYISRPDLGLDEDVEYPGNDMPLTSDLPKELQAKLMYVSEIGDEDPNSGHMCERTSFPHRCSVTISQKDQGKENYDYLVKITFEDNSYAATKVTIPYPTTLHKPLIVEPTEEPSQNSKLDLKFQDVGATYYEVIVERCGKYLNNGINPCLDDTKYGLKRTENNELKEAYPSEINIPIISITDGIVHVSSTADMQSEESINYTVNARLESEINGIATITNSSDTKTFTRSN